jgi:hypothetical protein
MPERIIKLNAETAGFLIENDYPKMITIPENTFVTHLAGDIRSDRVVKVRYGNQTLSVFTSDLRAHSQHVMEHSVSFH